MRTRLASWKSFLILMQVVFNTPASLRAAVGPTDVRWERRLRGATSLRGALVGRVRPEVEATRHDRCSDAAMTAFFYTQ